MVLAFETRRKLVHILEGSTAAMLVFYDAYPRLLLGGALLVVLGVSLISHVYDLPAIEFLIRELDRGPEHGVLPAQGTISLLIGSLLATLLFQKSVALAAITVVTLGDSLNALVGRYIGEITNPINPHRNVEGFLAGLVASTLVAAVFITLPLAFLVAAAGMLVEAANLPIDDNVTIPLTVGSTYYLLTPATSAML